MNQKTIAVTALALLLGASGLVSAKASSASVAGPTASGYGQDRRDWDTPPGEFNDIQRRGFHDGIEGARKDMDNHRRPDVNNRDEYRHPDVPREMRRSYRDAFRRGYEQAMSHLMGGRDRQ
jgi:hypothetical protein